MSIQTVWCTDVDVVVKAMDSGLEGSEFDSRLQQMAFALGQDNLLLFAWGSTCTTWVSTGSTQKVEWREKQKIRIFYFYFTYL